MVKTLADISLRFSPSLSSSIERVGMNDLHQLVVVPVVHRYPDNYGSLHREGSLKRGRDLIWRVDLQPASAERLGKLHNVDRAELHTGITAVLRQLLETDHVISTVN